VLPPAVRDGDHWVLNGSKQFITNGRTGDVAVIAAGITLEEAVKAAEQLAGAGVNARVLDCYSIKPIDAEALRTAGRETRAIITVEDHWPEGGLGDAVLEALAEHRYDGWLVLEQDTAIIADEPAVDGGPMRDATQSIAFINSAQTEENDR